MSGSGRPLAARLTGVIDLKAARQEPDRYRAALARRGAADDFGALLAADARWRELTERTESLRAEQKKSSKGGPPGPEQKAMSKPASWNAEKSEIASEE